MKDLEHIQFDVVRSWARITLNQPKKHNALSLAMLREIAAALWEADEDRDVHAILIRGAGPSFSSGYDMAPEKQERKMIRPEATNFRGRTSIDDDIWHMETSQRLLMTPFDIHKPVVAQVHGSCIAGGLDLALQCDLVVAADDAVIGFPPVRIMGTPPQNMWLWNIPVQWAKRLLLTGDVLSGADAATIGLVLESWPGDELAGACEALMDRISLIDADVLAANKRSLNLAMELMGARTLQRLALELDGRGHRAASFGQFVDTIKEHGLKEAIVRRDAGFGDGRVRVRNR